MTKIVIIIILCLATLLGLSFFFLVPTIDLTDPKSFHFKDGRLTKVAAQVTRQNQIFEMDDCSRDQKYLNGVPIRMTKDFELKDTGCCRYNYQCCPKYYKTVLDSLNISVTLFDSLKKQLTDTKLYSFCKSRDSVLFIVDGFLDTDWGFMYSDKRLGSDTNYFYFANHSIKFVDSIGPTWRRVAVH